MFIAKVYICFDVDEQAHTFYMPSLTREMKDSQAADVVLLVYICFGIDQELQALVLPQQGRHLRSSPEADACNPHGHTRQLP
jgi:hypothetical protein